jgi:hypothetical protein
MESDKLIGSWLKPYQVLERLGKGGYEDSGSGRAINEDAALIGCRRCATMRPGSENERWRPDR